MIELVIKIPEGLKNDFESEQWTALSCMEMKDALMNGTPLRRGHWIEGEVWEDSDGGWGSWQECSVCRLSEHHKTNFCPNCGAEMENE